MSLGALGPKLGPFVNFDPMAEPLRFSSNLTHGWRTDINVNLAEETHPWIEFQGALGPLEGPRNGYKGPLGYEMSHRPIVSHIIWKRLIFQTKWRHQYVPRGPSAQARALCKFWPNGRAPTIFFKFDTRMKEDINVNLAEETHPWIEF